MMTSNVLPLLGHVGMRFVCENLGDRDSQARYRVPLCHRPLTRFFHEDDNVDAGKAALEALPNLKSTEQIRTVLSEGTGIGLWAPRRLVESGDRWSSDPQVVQLMAGSILIYPPAEWETVRSEMKDWFFEGIDEAFRDLPYGFDDILPFAGPNFTPDCWYLVLRGPMAGAVCWWSHDGDSEMEAPWAADIQAWGNRVGAEVPDILGGMIRFSAAASLGQAPSDAELYPIEYQHDITDQG